jgi:hypothetical protein
VRITIDVNDRGGLAVGAHLKRIGGRAGDLRPAGEAVHQLLMRAIDYQYGRGGPAIGGWKPDAPSTVARKRRLGMDVRVMHETGRLRASLTDAKHADHVWHMTRSGAYLTTKVDYAKYLLDGGRPPVIVSQTATARAAALISDYILGVR